MLCNLKKTLSKSCSKLIDPTKVESQTCTENLVVLFKPFIILAGNRLKIVKAIEDIEVANKRFDGRSETSHIHLEKLEQITNEAKKG